MKSIYLYSDGTIRVEAPLVSAPAPFVEFAQMPNIHFDDPGIRAVCTRLRFRFVTEACGEFYVYEQVPGDVVIEGLLQQPDDTP